VGDVTATRDATPTVNERAGEAVDDRRDSSAESPFDPPRERFETRGELGRGGMGRVADAYDHALGRAVAIKEMLTGSDVDLARFEREARITARLEHPGIVPIHDAGRTADGTPFYVMRRIDGRPLDKLLDDKLEARLALIPNVLAACDAIAFAHARGVVHRDLKPTNILVGPFGETLVIDWGLARELGTTERAIAIPASDPKLTRAGTVAGTPGFMAPEQARGESVDARADVFALGATLFFVLAGQPPYGSASATEMVDLAGAGREPDWRRIPAAVPPELRAIAKKAMAPTAALRYADGGALAADLRRFVTGNLVGAYDYGLAAKLVRFVRRHRAAVAVAAVSAVLVVAIAVLAVRRIVSERDDANAARAHAQGAANRLLVQHARALADIDPVAAVITLRSLPESSGEDAWTPAAAAYIHGIPIGFAGAGTSFGVVRISRDGRRALVSSWKDNSVTLVDLVARTSRVVTRQCPQATSASWLGPDHAVCLGYPTQIVDLRTGQTRPLDVDATTVYSDRSSRVWLETNDRRLLELDDPDGTPREIATGVTAVATNDDLSVAMLGFDGRWEVRVRDRTLAVPTNTPEGVPYVSSDRVALYDGKLLSVWRIESDRIVLDETFPEPLVISAALVTGAAFVSTPRGLFSIRDGHEQRLDEPVGVVTPTAKGCMIVTADGAIRVYDRTGWMTVQRHAGDLTHADLSPDGAHLVATTSAGEILYWDLHALAPLRVEVDSDWSIVKLTARSLWMASTVQGVARVDLTTGKLAVEVKQAATTSAFADDGDRWVAGFAASRTLAIFDRVANKHFSMHDVSLATTDGTGMVVTRSDGTLWRWRPGSDHLQALDSLRGQVTMIAAGDDQIAALVDSQLVRVDAVHKSTDRIAAPPGTEVIYVRGTGDVYVLAHGVAWAWYAGTNELVRVPIAQPIQDIGSFGHSLLLSSAHSLIRLEDGIMRVTSIRSGEYPVYFDNRHVVLRGDHGFASVTDLNSGARFEMPQTVEADNVVARDLQIAAVTWLTKQYKIVTVWNLDIPEEPHALAAWLAGITNARPIGDSEIYAWP
jgi:WD40 repeat protein